MPPADLHLVHQGVPFRPRRAMRPGDVPNQVRRMPGASSPETSSARSFWMGSYTSNAPCQTQQPEWLGESGWASFLAHLVLLASVSAEKGGDGVPR